MVFIYFKDYIQGVEVKHFYGSTRLQICTKKKEPFDIGRWLKKLLCFEFIAALNNWCTVFVCEQQQKALVFLPLKRSQKQELKCVHQIRIYGSNVSCRLLFQHI